MAHTTIRIALLALAPAIVLGAAVQSRTAPASSAQSGDLGRARFEAHCSSCHEIDGRGTEGGPPPLEGSPWVSGPESRPIKIVMHGLRGRIEVNGKSYNLEMPGFGRVLTDAEIAAVLSFVRASWGRVREPITPESVGRIRAATRERTDYWTVEELVRDP